MKKLYKAVQELVARNATHIKSGVRLNDLTVAQIFNHAHAELCELYYATGGDVPAYRVESDEAQRRELGDLFAILCHVMVRKRWTPEQIESAALDKLQIRFR